MKMYELLATPDKWCKGVHAVNVDGMFCSPNAAEAVAWCLEGACWKCYERKGAAWGKIRERLKIPYVWNDAPERAHAEVLALCKELDI